MITDIIIIAKDPLDVHCEKLETKIQVLNKTTEHN